MQLRYAIERCCNRCTSEVQVRGAIRDAIIVAIEVVRCKSELQVRGGIERCRRYANKKYT